MDIAAKFRHSPPYRGFTALKATFSDQTFVYLMCCVTLLAWCILVGFQASDDKSPDFIGDDIVLSAAARLSFPRNSLSFPVLLYCIA